MFLTRLRRTWLFCHNIIPYHIPFLSDVVLLRYVRCTFIPSTYKHNFITLPFLIKMPCLLNCSSLETKHFTIYILSKLHFAQMFQKKIAFTIFGLSWPLWRVFIFYGVIICFILFPFYSLVWFLEFWNDIYCLSNTFYHFLYFLVYIFTI